MDVQCLWLCFLWMETVWSMDEVKLLNPPEECLPEHPMEIRYSCAGSAVVQLDCIVSFETGRISTLLLRQWSCVPRGAKVKKIMLTLPDWLVYQADGVVAEVQPVLSCMLRVTVRHRGRGSTGEYIQAQDVATLQPKPLFSRPFKYHQVCMSWSKQMLLLALKPSQRHCCLEQETVHLLSGLFASTGENFGITKTMESYNDEMLEYHRLRNHFFPWCTISFWIFLTNPCKDDLCGIFYHIDSKNNYTTPTILLAKNGHLHVQVHGEDGESTAFLSLFRLPLNKWCKVILLLEGRKATISMVCVGTEDRTVYVNEHVFRHVVMLDDTEGYFVIGGGMFIRGVQGYFGPAVFNRNKVLHHKMSDGVVPDVIKRVNLTGWLQSCQEFRHDLTAKIDNLVLMEREKIGSDTCSDAFNKWMKEKGISAYPQCEPWEEIPPHRKKSLEVAKSLIIKFRKRVSLAAVGTALYSLSVQKLRRASSIEVVRKVQPLLLQTQCLNNNRALYLPSVLYSSALGVQRWPVKAWLLALLAAQKDDRLALLHLGHLHHQGLHGLPKDLDLAYAYYANIAKQTTIDRHNYSKRQSFVEAIHLNNEDSLKIQTHTDHHIFHWLKHQAQRGVVEAEQAIGRMLFWGQQGMPTNIQEAVKHYRRGAEYLNDPTSMYNYGIVLLQGHGVEKDVPKGVAFLKKSMEQGFAPAFSALAWYYEHFEGDYQKAVELWEKADLLGCADAAFDLGIIHSLGLYPGKPANQLTAYTYFMKSANRGQINGAVRLAEVWTTGLPGYVNRRPADAVLWVKWAAEQNGYLGAVLQKALDSYVHNDMLSSFLFYTMAAELGYAPAQFNVAYLCEQNMGNFLGAANAKLCMFIYYNLTIQNEQADTYAFLRMGDLLYEGHGDSLTNLSSAAQMYARAALRGNPQGWYNLGLLVEVNYKLPLSILTDLGLSEFYIADKTLLLTTLYKRCRDSDDTDAYVPCSLALFKVFLKSFHNDNTAFKLYSAVAVVMGPSVLLIAFGGFRRWFLSLSWN